MFESYALTTHDVLALRAALRDDAAGFLFKGMLSLCEAIGAIRQNLFSWAVVRLYYSCFYSAVQDNAA